MIASQQISDLRSEQQAAQRRLELARLTFQREQQLWQERISAEQDYLQARQALQEAEIALANARQKVAAVGPAGAGNRYELRAPFDAVVVEKHLTVGEVVDETSNAFTLSDLSRVWATFAVAPRDLDKVVTGRNVTVSAPDLGAQVEGKVNYVGSLLGEQNRARHRACHPGQPQRRLAPRVVRQRGCQRRTLQCCCRGAGKRPANLGRANRCVCPH